jgi:AcrR family transcriptional regulator
MVRSRPSATPERSSVPVGPVAARVRQGRHLTSPRRRRLLAATYDLAAEQGVRSISVGGVCRRAGVSRRTFHDLFADREACLLAAFEEAHARAERAIAKRVRDVSGWPDQVRQGIFGLLELLDAEPVMAEFLIVHAPGAGSAVAARRNEAIATLAASLAVGGSRATGRDASPLLAEAAVGASISVVHGRLLERRAGGASGRLVDLTGALTALIVQPYLGPAVARKELEKADSTVPSGGRGAQAADPLSGLSIRLTYRTAQVLGSIAVAPGASSKQVAAASGVADEGQMSRLLARLERCDLVRNAGGDPARGEARAWRLTALGEDVIRTVSEVRGKALGSLG